MLFKKFAWSANKLTSIMIITKELSIAAAGTSRPSCFPVACKVPSQVMVRPCASTAQEDINAAAAALAFPGEDMSALLIAWPKILLEQA